MNGQIELKWNGRKVTVMGGPYRDKPANVKGVKLAQEIKAPADVVFDIADFQAPNVNDCNAPLYKALDILEQDGVIYVGCMGGIGRTGMFLSLLVKTIATDEQARMRSSWWGKVRQFFGFPASSNQNALMIYDPVGYVRAHYLSYAVETAAQQKLIEQFEPQILLTTRLIYKDFLRKSNGL